MNYFLASWFYQIIDNVHHHNEWFSRRKVLTNQFAVSVGRKFFYFYHNLLFSENSWFLLRNYNKLKQFFPLSVLAKNLEAVLITSVIDNSCQRAQYQLSITIFFSFFLFFLSLIRSRSAFPVRCIVMPYNRYICSLPLNRLSFAF